MKSAWSPELFNQHYLVEDQIKQVTKDEFRLRQLYRKHNAHVINTVPKETLLVWNLKDGWEPLCKFLNKSIPGSSSWCCTSLQLKCTVARPMMLFYIWEYKNFNKMDLFHTTTKLGIPNLLKKPYLINQLSKRFS